MKLSQYLEKSRDYTEQTSNVARQFNFAGIVIIWLVLYSKEDVEISNCYILFPLITIITSLFFDFLQYAFAAFLWKDFYKKKIKEGIEADEDVIIKEEDKWRRKRFNSFYYVKFILTVISYILIVAALIKFLN